jgi:hypothetical protein
VRLDEATGLVVERARDGQIVGASQHVEERFGPPRKASPALEPATSRRIA